MSTPQEMSDLSNYVKKWGVTSVIETLADLVVAPEFRSENEDDEAHEADIQLRAALRRITEHHDMSWY